MIQIERVIFIEFYPYISYNNKSIEICSTKGPLPRNSPLFRPKV